MRDRMNKIDFSTSYRTHSCGCLRKENIGEMVKLVGWIRYMRDHGGAKFIDLCDREGCTQVVFEEGTFKDMETVEHLGKEYVIGVEGKVRKRPEGTEDPENPTGEIEVLVEKMKIISKSKLSPFELIEEKRSLLPSMELRLEYRFLDLRRREMVENLWLRNEVMREVREFFWERGFWEIETPYLVKSTPEGARDFVVPVRAIPGTFFALPQSPQLYKQLLMISGFDRYFQLARCFRDEDLREDRQPEFTQIDVEMSFVEREDILNLIEELIERLWKKLLNFEDVRFRRMKFDEAMEKYGTDKPDTRYGMEIKDVTDTVKNVGYRIFKRAIENGARVKCLRADGLHRKGFTSKDAQKLIDFIIKKLKGKGMTWLIVEDGDLKSVPQSIANSFGEKVRKELIRSMGAKDGDILMFVVDEEYHSLNMMGEIRKLVGSKWKVDLEERWSFVWLIDPPYFERDQYGNILNKPSHHPFTAPLEMSIEYLERPREEIYANAYDLIINGVEIGGGSIRIHLPNVQRKIFELLGYTEEEMRERFGFLLRALEYGAPPHGGIAIGLDRLVAMMKGKEDIRDFIAFPKTKSFRSPVDDSPSRIDEEKLRELGIIILRE